MANELILKYLSTLAGQLLAYEMLCQAMIKTHPDRPALYGEFLTRAKFADAQIPSDAQEQMRASFDAAYAQIVTAIQAER